MEASETDYGESTGGSPDKFWKNFLRIHAENPGEEHSNSQDSLDQPFINQFSVPGDLTFAGAISHIDLDNNVLQSSALYQVSDKNDLQSSALDQVPGKNVLQSSAFDQPPGSSVLQDPVHNTIYVSSAIKTPLKMSDNLALLAPTANEIPNKKSFQNNPEQMDSIEDDEECINRLFTNPKWYLENKFPKLTEEQQKSLDQDILNEILPPKESRPIDAASQSLGLGISPKLLILQDGVTLGKNVQYSSALDQSVSQSEKQVLSFEQITGKNVPQGSVLDQAPGKNVHHVPTFNQTQGNNILQASAHDTTYISSSTQTPDKMSYNTALPVPAVNQISDKKTFQKNSVKTQTLTQSQEKHRAVSVAYTLEGESKKIEIQVDSHNPTPQSTDFLTAIPHKTSGDISVSNSSPQRCLKRECDIISTSDTFVMGKKPKLHEIREPFTNPMKEHGRQRAIYQHRYRENKKRESKDSIKELNQERARREDIEKQLEIMTCDRDQKTTMIQQLQKQLNEAAKENVKNIKVICLLEKNLELKKNECNNLWKTYKELLNISLQQNDKTQ